MQRAPACHATSLPCPCHCGIILVGLLGPGVLCPALFPAVFPACLNHLLCMCELTHLSGTSVVCASCLPSVHCTERVSTCLVMQLKLKPKFLAMPRPPVLQCPSVSLGFPFLLCHAPVRMSVSLGWAFGWGHHCTDTALAQSRHSVSAHSEGWRSLAKWTTHDTQPSIASQWPKLVQRNGEVDSYKEAVTPGGSPRVTLVCETHHKSVGLLSLTNQHGALPELVGGELAT